MAGTPFEKAKSGFVGSATYDLHRPSYPVEAVESLLRSLNVSGMKNARLLDLGAGTGKFTEILAGREETYEILAVEPHPNMRAELARKNLPGVKVVEGSAEKMDIDSQWADAVIVAQVGLSPLCALYSIDPWLTTIAIPGFPLVRSKLLTRPRRSMKP